MYCKKCGEKIADKSLFCEFCGAKQDVEKANDEKKETDKEVIYGNQTGKTNNNKKVETMALVSFILGIASIILSFLISILVLPLSITGFVLGLLAKEKSGYKTAGIVLNIISTVIGIILGIIIGLLIQKGWNFTKDAIKKGQDELNKQIEEQEKDSLLGENSVSGKWRCKTSEEGDYVLTLELNKYYTFTWSEDNSSDEINGTYFVDEKDDDDSEYTKYELTLYGSDYDLDSNNIPKFDDSEYEMKIDKKKEKSILTNTENNNTYYCDIK